MKKVLLILLLITSVAFAKKPIGMASGDRVPPTNVHTVQEVVNGRSMSLIYSGASNIKGSSASVTTSWMHTGWTDADGVKAEAVSGILASRFDATTFTLTVNLDTFNVGDSTGLWKARFETAIDTAKDKTWNADRTNFFIDPGNPDSAFYGQWLFDDIEPLVDDTENDTITWAFPLRVLHPGWIRFVFESTTFPTSTKDTVIVNWTLVCKNGG